MREELYENIHKAAVARHMNVKATGRFEKLNILDTAENRRHFFTIGLASTNLKYEFTVTSKRRVDLVGKLIETVHDRLRLAKTEQLHWNRLQSLPTRFEMVLPNSAEIDPRLFGCKVTIDAISYDDLNHELKGLLHAIYGTATNLARIKIHDMPNEDKV